VDRNERAVAAGKKKARPHVAAWEMTGVRPSDASDVRLEAFPIRNWY
jgi:hypothetical protein